MSWKNSSHARQGKGRAGRSQKIGEGGEGPLKSGNETSECHQRDLGRGLEAGKGGMGGLVATKGVPHRRGGRFRGAKWPL